MTATRAPLPSPCNLLGNKDPFDVAIKVLRLLSVTPLSGSRKEIEAELETSTAAAVYTLISSVIEDEGLPVHMGMGSHTATQTKFHTPKYDDATTTRLVEAIGKKKREFQKLLSASEIDGKIALPIGNHELLREYAQMLEMPAKDHIGLKMDSEKGQQVTVSTGLRDTIVAELGRTNAKG